MTAVKKDESDWYENEKEIMDEIRFALPLMGDKYVMPTKEQWFLSYEFLNALMSKTDNPDYSSKDISAQTAQQTLKLVTRDMDSFLEGCRAYADDPSPFTGRPKLPKYKKKGGTCTALLTNQDCSITTDDKGMAWLKLPYTKKKLALGKEAFGRLKEVRIVPYHNVFIIHAVTEEEAEECKYLDPNKIFSIDLGVNNLAAVANNFGAPCLIFKGGAIKSANQLYNKQMARIQSEQTAGTTNKFQMTEEAHIACIKRNNVCYDTLHKVGLAIIKEAVKDHVGTMICGHNDGWKTESNLGKINNQNFVQIPFSKLIEILRYLCEENGINFIEREESYTSQASFIDGDFIPTYGKEPEAFSFSGERGPKYYKGQFRSKGFRGIYKTENGVFINSDLNGAANIGRKEFPELFTMRPEDFENVIIIEHPDLENRKALQKRQQAKKKVPSKRKLKRLRRKGQTSRLKTPAA
ncbi:MAG: transposase [Clostridia bacterium]|nr:transposase [Clostridia bacterium]